MLHTSVFFAVTLAKRKRLLSLAARQTARYCLSCCSISLVLLHLRRFTANQSTHKARYIVLCTVTGRLRLRSVQHSAGYCSTLHDHLTKCPPKPPAREPARPAKGRGPVIS